MTNLENKAVRFFKKVGYRMHYNPLNIWALYEYDCGQKEPCYQPICFAKCPEHGGLPTTKKMPFKRFYAKKN